MQKGIASKKAYNYDSFLLSHLESDNIPEEIYLNLVNTAKNNTKPLQRYLKLRKKILGLKKYYNFDGSINLIEFDKEYEYDDAEGNGVKFSCSAWKRLRRKNEKSDFRSAGWMYLRQKGKEQERILQEFTGFIHICF